MRVPSDIEIAQSCQMRPIGEIAAAAGVEPQHLELYGNYKAKVDYNILNETPERSGKLVLVTAINPTPAGEGKGGIGTGPCQQPGTETGAASSAASCGPALRAAGHGTHRPDCGGILFLKIREDYFVRQLDKTLTIRE